MRTDFIHRLSLLLVLGLLTFRVVSGFAATPGKPDVTVIIASPSAGELIGGDNVRVENQVTHSKDIEIKAVETQVTEIGTPALSLPLSVRYASEKDNGKSTTYLETLNTLPMHNGPCNIITRVVCQQGEKQFIIRSKPVLVTVKNLWITQASPSTAFFTVQSKGSETISVNFEHYKTAGPYRVEYTFRMPISTEIIRTIVHDHVVAHQDSCTFTADKETFPWGAYVCFDIKITCDNDAATLISPTCKMLKEDFELLHDTEVHVVYALSEAPKPGGLTILLYSDLNLLSLQEGLSEQCRDWEHPVVMPFIDKGSLRSIFIGTDNHTDNRGRAPQPFMPEG